MDNRKKLHLIDAYALILEIYAFIKNPRINSKGYTSAIMGFMNCFRLN